MQTVESPSVLARIVGPTLPCYNYVWQTNPSPDWVSSSSVAVTRRQTLFKIAAVLIALLGSLALVELALRGFYGKIERITGVTAWKHSEWGGITYTWDRYHEKFGWTNVPGYRSDDRIPFELTINQQELRADREYAPEPPPGVQRIALFGDSCTFGEEVNDDQTIPVYLEQMLRDVEVLNFGVHGYGLGQMALRLEDEGFAFQPDHVVVVYLTMDFTRDPMPEFSHPKPVFGVENGRLLITNVPVPEATRQGWWLTHCFTAAYVCGRPRAIASPDDLPHSLQVFALLLQRIRDACATRGVPLTMVHITGAGTLEDMRMYSRMRSVVRDIQHALRESDADVLDLVDFLGREYSAGGEALTMPNGHWGGSVNKQIAGRIAERLVQKDESLRLNGE